MTGMVLFGSFARDEATDGSDIDILVKFDAPPDWRRYFGAGESDRGAGPT